MHLIHCIHCNHINNDNDVICKNCHKTLYEIDKYYTDMLKDHVTGRVKDTVTDLLLKLIKENLYGIVMTITVISTVVVNVAARNDNPKVINEYVNNNQLVVNNDGIKSNTPLDALKVLGEAVYTDNYDLLKKSSYQYNFNNIFNNDITNLTKYGLSLEEVKQRYSSEDLYIQITDYSDEHYGLTNEFININNHALNILSDENTYSTDKVNIANISDITSYELELFVYKTEPHIYSNLDAFYYMTVFYAKVNNNWYYLYSSTAKPRIIGKRSGGLTYRDGDFVQLLS